MTFLSIWIWLRLYDCPVERLKIVVEKTSLFILPVPWGNIPKSIITTKVNPSIFRGVISGMFRTFSEGYSLKCSEYWCHTFIWYNSGGMGNPDIYGDIVCFTNY